jgi:hypothetical protein
MWQYARRGKFPEENLLNRANQWFWLDIRQGFRPMKINIILPEVCFVIRTTVGRRGAVHSSGSHLEVCGEKLRKAVGQSEMEESHKCFSEAVMVLLSVWVIRDGIWIGNWIYRKLTDRNYK